MNEKSRLPSIVIGSFAAVATIIFSSALLFLKPSYGNGEKLLKVRFSNIDKINVGTKVTLAGKPIGQVKSIQLVGGARTQPQFKELYYKPPVYLYEILLEVDSNVELYPEDVFTTQTAGLLGEKSVAIIPNAIDPTNPSKPIESNQIIYALAPPTIEETINQFNFVAQQMQKSLGQVSQLLELNSAQLSTSLVNFSKASDAISNVFSTMDKQHFIEQLDKTANEIEQTSATCRQTVHNLNEKIDAIFNTQTIENVQKSVAHVEQILQSFDKPEDFETIVDQTKKVLIGLNELETNVNQSWPSIKTTLTQAEQASKTFNEAASQTLSISKDVAFITNKVAKGEGTVGHLLSKDDLYIDLHQTLIRLNTVLNDINQYGVLFHMNRTWKQNRSDKMAQIQQLKTPRDFQACFDEEVQNLQLSISHIDSLMEKATSGKLSKDPRFQKEIRSFLDRTQNLQQMILLLEEHYNPEKSDR